MQLRGRDDEGQVRSNAMGRCTVGVVWEGHVRSSSNVERDERGCREDGTVGETAWMHYTTHYTTLHYPVLCIYLTSPLYAAAPYV